MQRISSHIAAVGARLAAAGLSPGSSGNISVRLAEGILCTPTGSDLGALDGTELSVLDWSGHLLAGPRPTKEVPVHYGAYAAVPAVRAVVHLHSPFATAVSCLVGLDADDAVPALTPYLSMRAGRVGVIAYRSPGDPALGGAVGERIARGYRCLLLANHGSVVAAESLDAAVAIAFELEESARLQLLLAGRDVNVIPEEERARLLP